MAAFYDRMREGTWVPTERQLKAMMDNGFSFPELILVAPPRKPRDNSGHELPANLLNLNHGCFWVQNPYASGSQKRKY